MNSTNNEQNVLSTNIEKVNKTQKIDTTTTTQNFSYDDLFKLQKLAQLKHMENPDILFDDMTDGIPYTKLVNSTHTKESFKMDQFDFDRIPGGNPVFDAFDHLVVSTLPFQDSTFYYAKTKRPSNEKLFAQELMIDTGKYLSTGRSIQRQKGNLSSFQFSDLWYLGEIDVDYTTVDAFGFSIILTVGQNAITAPIANVVSMGLDHYLTAIARGDYNHLRPVLYDENARLRYGITVEHMFRLTALEAEAADIVLVDVSRTAPNATINLLADNSQLLTDANVRYLREILSPQDWAWSFWLISSHLVGDRLLANGHVYGISCQTSRSNFIDQCISYFANDRGTQTKEIGRYNHFNIVSFRNTLKASSVLKTLLFQYNLAKNCAISPFLTMGDFWGIFDSAQLRDLYHDWSFNCSHWGLVVAAGSGIKTQIYIPYEYICGWTTGNKDVKNWHEVEYYVSDFNVQHYTKKMVRPRGMVVMSNATRSYFVDKAINAHHIMSFNDFTVPVQFPMPTQMFFVSTYIEPLRGVIDFNRTVDFKYLAKTYSSDYVEVSTIMKSSLKTSFF